MSVYEPMTLRPASPDCFRLELLACLTLVAPAGMSDELRLEWVKVARETLKDVPEDLLKQGCAAARQEADHPRQIVPIIMKTIGGALKIRRDFHRSGDPYRVEPLRQIEAKRPTAEQIASILRDTGFSDVAAKVEKGERI